MVRAYQAIFPGLLQAAERMPAALREHVRYPEDLFSVQARVLSRFHVPDPLVFYNQTSFWDIPNETLEQASQSAGARSADGTLLRDDAAAGEDAAEYLLIQPFVFRGGPNLAAWLAARCGPEATRRDAAVHLRRQCHGAHLVIQRIIRSLISSGLTLLGQQGSRVVWGNLLVLPMADTLLYVRPLYVSAATAEGGGHARPSKGSRGLGRGGRDGADARCRAGSTLPRRRAEPRDGRRARSPRRDRPGSVGEPGPAQAVEADEALRAAQQALARSDWVAYGQHMQRLQRAVVECGD